MWSRGGLSASSELTLSFTKCSDFEAESLVHVHEGDVGSDSCLNEDTASVFPECCSTLMGSVTVTFEGHVGPA